MWSAFSHIRAEFGDLESKSPYSVHVKENEPVVLRIWTLFMCTIVVTVHFQVDRI